MEFRQNGWEQHGNVLRKSTGRFRKRETNYDLKVVEDSLQADQLPTSPAIEGDSRTSGLELEMTNENTNQEQGKLITLVSGQKLMLL